MKTRLGIWIAAFLAGVCAAAPARAQTPDVAKSFFVPEAGPVGAPLVGDDAVGLFRACPNNDGGSSLPLSTRVKVTLIDAFDAPIVGVAAADIYIKFNGGTAVQGFSGDGADSIIANDIYNTDPACPLVQYLYADAATDVSGVTYITFGGGDPLSPGSALRDANRKWGHFDAELPVFANGVQLQGRLTAGGTNGDYVLRIKSFDLKGGLANGNNQGEVVSNVDYNSVKGAVGGPPDDQDYWRDFDWSGAVNSTDFNMMVRHMDHDCGAPNSP